MAGPPTEEQLLVINCLMYAFTEDEKPGEHDSIYDWANRLAKDEARLDAVADAERGMITSDEFKMLVNTVVANRDVYGQMKVMDVQLTPGSPDAGPEGAGDWTVNMAINYDGKPIIAFKGTSGDLQWIDDGVGAYIWVTDTPEQQAALDYYAEWLGHFPPGTTGFATGHSAGANKAQAVALLLGDQVDHAFSFDGQGFDPAFLLKYDDEISENGKKITNISNNWDFINWQLLAVPGAEQLYIKRFPINTWSPPSDSIPRWHSPVTMLERDGGVLKLDMSDASDSPSLMMAELNDVMAFLQLHMTAQNWAYLSHLAVSSRTKAPVVGDELEGMEMPDGFIMELLSLVKNHLEIQGLDWQDITWGGALLVKQIFAWTMNPVLMALAASGTYVLARLFATIPSKGYAGVPRDFRPEVKKLLMALADEVADEPWWDVTKWDVWYRIDHSVFGGVDFAADESERAVYHRKMIDMNGTSRAEIERIFTEVYAADGEFAATVQGWRDKAENVLSELRNLSAGVPS
jgi:hypothetical protein